MGFDIFFSLLWLWPVRTIKHDYELTGNKVQLVSEIVTTLIGFAINVLYVRMEMGL